MNSILQTINRYIVFLYVFLISAIIALLADLIIHLIKTMKYANQTGDGINKISEDIDQTSKKLETISASKDSWSFFLAVYGIYLILKETLKYRKSERSVSRSFAKACVKQFTRVRKISL